MKLEKKYVSLCALVLVGSLILGNGMNIPVGLKAEAAETAGETPEPTLTPEPVPTSTPTAVPTPEPTAEPTATPTHVPAPEPVLGKVSGIKLIRYSTNAVKVSWKKHKKAEYYRVYYAQKKEGKYRLAGVTQKTHFLVKKLKNKKTYYFYVQACAKKKASLSDSQPSKKVHLTMKTYRRKIIFAGDSICEGIGYGQAYSRMHSSALKKTVAYRGLNTVTFHTKRIFGGRTGLQKLIAQKPYRVYMMLGMNEIHYRPASQMIAEYKDMIRAIQQACPSTDIVLCAVSPVTRAERARHPGMRQIPIFNKKLKKLEKKLGVRYFDYTAFLKDSGGYLKAQYASGDGYHWKPAAYVKFGTVTGKFDKELDS